ncbi:hypothetical protein [Streptomyces sp. 2P-4]|nr:hypothetical protein [Streptomyces sp. 2P-4]
MMTHQNPLPMRLGAGQVKLIGEADPGLGMTAHSISAADSGEALEEKII